MILRSILLLLFSVISARAADDVFKDVKRILFLGDSITYSGQYVTAFEAFLVTKYPDREFSVINCGLPSETVSGLSEEGHADGKFPRPDLHERLDRVLALAKPDLVFACYGMNCGISQPFDETRFAAYQSGIERMIAKCEAVGAKVILLTPFLYDAQGQPGFDYDDVLQRYSRYLLQMRSQRRVVDIHGALEGALEEKRKTDPAFTFSKDKVHPDQRGHLVAARALVVELFPDRVAEFAKLIDGEWSRSEPGKKFLGAVAERSAVLKDAYLTTAGHQRPGMAKGVSVAEAEARAAELTKTIRELSPE